MIHVVSYVYDPAAEEAISAARPAHREFLAGLHARGDLIASGPWVGGPAGAYLLMKADSGEHALEILEADPFHTAGLILERTVQEWNPVIGVLA